MNTKIVLAQVAAIYIAMLGVGNAAPPELGPVPVEVINTTSNPVPVVGNVNTSVSNFPETQNVSITNKPNNPVPVSHARDLGQIVLNTSTISAGAGLTEVRELFETHQVTFVNASGLDEKVTVVLYGNDYGKLVLLGNMGSGIGQEDYVISLSEPIYVDKIEVTCDEQEIAGCKVFVQILGNY